MIKIENLLKFKYSVIVLDDMGDKFILDIACYFTDLEQHKNEMIVMCHKPAQIMNTSRMSCDVLYNNL